MINSVRNCSILLCALYVIGAYNSYSQSAPEAINWQGVARDSLGRVLVEANISLRLSILSGSLNGPAVYTETHLVTSNPYGIVNTQIGTGQSVVSFNSIKWGTSAHYLKVEFDASGTGLRWHEMGVSQLVSVPYAFFSESAASVTGLPMDGEHGESLNWCYDGPVWGACPTCSDGIQNGDETGVDCGGSRCDPCVHISSCNGFDTLVDPRDGQVYNIVQIGNQCWMADNLNYGSMVLSTSGTQQTDNGLPEKYCFYNSEQGCSIYGALYEWIELLDYSVSSNQNPSGVQGLCPPGWHVPSDAEWKQLEMHLGLTKAQADVKGMRGTDEGGSLKETGNTYWTSPNIGATNSTGFSAIGGGTRNTIGQFINLGDFGYYWTSTSSDSTLAWCRLLHHFRSNILRHDSTQRNGFACRCLKD